MNEIETQNAKKHAKGNEGSHDSDFVFVHGPSKHPRAAWLDHPQGQDHQRLSTVESQKGFDKEFAQTTT